MHLKAYAKINLGLKIIEKRPDGYHNIQTVFHRINLYDEIEINVSEKDKFIVKNANLPTDDSNLCIKALKIFREAYKINQNFSISLYKNIPIGAGLGGGSSDAAEILGAIPKLLNFSINLIELKNLADKLGADVPYFLQKGSAFATGIGNILEYFELVIPYWILTITPNIQISTQWAYQNLKLNPKDKQEVINLKEKLIKHMNDPIILKNLLMNDFEDIVLKNYPEINDIKNFLYKSGAIVAALSGSGSSIYGLFKDKKNMMNAYNKLKNNYFVNITEPEFVVK